MAPGRSGSGRGLSGLRATGGETLQLVIDYVKQKYGADSVSQIATFGTMAAKAAVREIMEKTL